MPVPNKRTAAILIALLGFMLRVHLAAVGPVEYDEPTYVRAAVLYADAFREGNLEKIFYIDYNYEHPAFNKLVYALGLLPFKPIDYNDTNFPLHVPLPEVAHYYKLLGLRLISAAAGAGAVWLLSLVSPAAGLLLAVHTFAVKYTSVIYLEALPAFASLAGFLAALKAFEQPGLSNKARAGWLALSAAAMGAALASKYMYGIVWAAALLSLLLLRKVRSRREFGLLTAWGAGCALFFFLFDPRLWLAPLENLSHSLQFSVAYAGSDPNVILYAYPLWQPLLWLTRSIPAYPEAIQAFGRHPGDYWIQLDTLILILAVLGLPRLYRKHLPMFIWLALGIAFLLAWNTKWPQYIMLILPPFCLSAACGLDALVQLFSRLRTGKRSAEARQVD